MISAKALFQALARPIVRASGVAALGVAGAIVYIAAVNDFYAVEDWLVWTLLILWGWCAVLHAACLSFGHLVLTRWLKLDDLPTLEKLVFSMALGLVGFTLAMFLAGVLALYQTFFAILLPIAMLAAGGPALWRFAADAWRRAAEATRERLSPWAVMAILGGVLGVVLLYLQCLTPESLNYDSRWYHLTVAEDYAREGRIVSFPADYNKAAFPQLTSLLNTWAWLLPGLGQPERWMFALHNEFCLVIWTLAGVGALAAWLLERERVAGSWAAFFLFPAIFVYDSNIGGSADHVLAFFSPPFLLAGVRALPDLAPRRCALVGAVAAGAVLTKYQSLYMIVPVGALLGGRWLWLTAARRPHPLGRWHFWRGPVTLLVVGTVLVLPHLLRKWVFYGNPLYPFQSEFFTGSTPSQPDMALLVSNVYTGDPTIPRGSLGKMLGMTLDNAYAFFVKKPYTFGFFLPLVLPLTLFLRRSRRVWLGVLVVVMAFLTWAFTYPIPRYLQAIVPVFAGVSAAIVIRAWQVGWIARIGTFALVATQVIWGGDAVFDSANDRLRDTIRVIQSGSKGKAKTRFEKYQRAQVALDELLPEDAVLLFHNSRLTLGVNRKTLQDLPGFQALISYRDVKTARELCELYRSVGATHMVHEPGVWPAFSKQEEAVIAAFLGHHAKNVFRRGGFEVVELPAELPPVEAPYRVLTFGLRGYPNGIYPVEALNVIEPLPAKHKRFPRPDEPVGIRSPRAVEALDRVDIVMAGNRGPLPPHLNRALRQRFKLQVSYTHRAHFSVYLSRARRRGR